MPQFCPEHTPANLDSFTRGYLDCAEWLLDEEVNRGTLRGWTRRAIGRAAADCAAFQRDHANDLIAYQKASGRDLEYAGHDFFLSRNRDGAGFWDRGDDPCLERLTAASHAFGIADTYVSRGWINFNR